MKIAWFANIDFEQGNAANSRIRIQAKGLKKNGNLIFLFFLSPTVFNSNGINKKSKGYFDGLSYKYLSGTSMRSPFLFLRIFNYLKSILNSSILLIKKRVYFDIIYISNPRLLFFGHIYLLAKVFQIPIIFEKTELEERVKCSTLFQKFIRFTDRLDARFYKFSCSHLIVISEKLKSHYSNYFPITKITKIPILVDSTRFISNGEPKISHTLGYLGSFASKDGVSGIVQGFKSASQKIPELKLKLIGFNPFQVELEAEIDRLGLSMQVEFSGQITNDEIPQWLNKCDLLILNRTADEYSQFGFPTKLGEYLATGIPTICSKVGDIVNYLEHHKNTYFIEAENHDELTAAIIERYKNYELFNEMGRNGKLFAAEEFNFTKYLPAIELIMSNLKR